MLRNQDNSESPARRRDAQSTASSTGTSASYSSSDAVIPTKQANQSIINVDSLRHKRLRRSSAENEPVQVPLKASRRNVVQYAERQEQQPHRQQKPQTLDRACPFLVHVFVNESKHFPLEKYSRGQMPSEVEYMHLWWDTTLHDILMILSLRYPRLAVPGTRCEFDIVYCEKETRSIRSRTVATVMCDSSIEAAAAADSPGHTRLDMCRLSIGDFIDIRILPSAMRRGRMRNLG